MALPALWTQGYIFAGLPPEELLPGFWTGRSGYPFGVCRFASQQLPANGDELGLERVGKQSVVADSHQALG
jgi:hypothetical protein